MRIEHTTELNYIELLAAMQHDIKQDTQIPDHIKEIAVNKLFNLSDLIASYSKQKETQLK